MSVQKINDLPINDLEIDFMLMIGSVSDWSLLCSAWIDKLALKWKYYIRLIDCQLSVIDIFLFYSRTYENDENVKSPIVSWFFIKFLF